MASAQHLTVKWPSTARSCFHGAQEWPKNAERAEKISETALHTTPNKNPDLHHIHHPGNRGPEVAKHGQSPSFNGRMAKYRQILFSRGPRMAEKCRTSGKSIRNCSPHHPEQETRLTSHTSPSQKLPKINQTKQRGQKVQKKLKTVESLRGREKRLKSGSSGRNNHF